MPDHRNSAAFTLCHSFSGFSLWAESIGLNQNVRNDLPPALQALLATSRKLPNWPTDENTDFYKPYKRRFNYVLEDLCIALARSNETNSLRATASGLDEGNATTSSTANTAAQEDAFTADLALCLLPILTIVKHGRAMQNRNTTTEEPNEATWRSPLDNLANFVWLYQETPGFSHLLECRLQLPRSNVGPVPETLVNSAALCKIPSLQNVVSEMDKALRRIFISPILAGPGHILHWVTEYKRQGDRLEQDVVRQTMLAMSSGLFQRRALGFPDHYVFGTAHCGPQLRVFAGTWTKRSIRVKEAGEASKKGEESWKIASGTNSEGSECLSNRRQTSKGKGADANQSQLADNGLEISFYELGSYSLLEPLDAMEYYLLIQASRDLARTYVAAICDPISLKRIRLAKFHSPLDWPASPRATPTSSVISSHTRTHTSILEGPGDRDDGSTRESNGLDMESAGTGSSVLGEPGQEAEWKDEWQVSYKKAIEEVGHGLPVRIGSVREDTSPRLEDKVTDYFDRLASNYAGE